MDMYSAVSRYSFCLTFFLSLMNMSGASLFSTSSSESLSTSVIEIKPLLVADSEIVKQVITTVAHEMQGLSESVDELLVELNEKKLFTDEDNLESVYFKNNGIFLKLVANNRLVGTGAVKKLTDDICEMKRMFILNEYRGQGWGKKIADQLFAFACEHGYKKMRLEVWRHPMVHRAVSFYKKLGFYEIPPYVEQVVPGALFMEKNLFRNDFIF